MRGFMITPVFFSSQVIVKAHSFFPVKWLSRPTHPVQVFPQIPIFDLRPLLQEPET